VCRAAVHDGSLTGINLHIYVIDVKSGQCGQDVLDRLYLKPVAADRGAELRRHQMLDRGCEAGSIFAVPVYKDHACIWWSRPECEGDGLSGVKPNS
jgi:hypothetical protein